MAFEIDIKEELHFPQLDCCPDAVKRDFRSAFIDLKTASRLDVKNANFDFLERRIGYPEYKIVSTSSTERYIVVFEIKESSDSKDILRVLQIGKEKDIIE